MLKGKSGETFWVALKQLASLLVTTLAATLVPPVPKPELSLTWEREKVGEHTSMIVDQSIDTRRAMMRCETGGGDLRLRRTVSWQGI